MAPSAPLVPPPMNIYYVQWNFVERLSSFRGDFFSPIECVYRSTFNLSFVGRFVLFQSVLYE